MGSIRKCKRSGCSRSAIATLTYVYSDSLVVLGPLAVYAEPHSYDLCEVHVERLKAPRGWELLRLNLNLENFEHSKDDLLALADAVRKVAKPVAKPVRSPVVEEKNNFYAKGVRRGHLRSLSGNEDGLGE